jgi:hypothetical protein
MDTQCLRKRGLDPAGGITDLKSVAVRVTSNHQPLYVPQSRLECTNAFHQTAGDANPYVDDFVDGRTGITWGLTRRLVPAPKTQVRTSGCGGGLERRYFHQVQLLRSWDG